MTAHPAGPGGAYWVHRDLACALALGASGIPCVLAGVELLIDHETWLLRDDFVTEFITIDNSVATALAFIDWDAAITALNAGRLPCSGGERALLRIAASMSGGIPVDLNDTLTSLDPATIDLTAAAIHNATGQAVLWKETEET